MTDTESVVHVINKQTAKDPKMLGLLRAMVFICLRNNIFFRARHIPGVKNVQGSTNSTHCPGVWIQHQPRCQHTFYQRTG